MKTKQSLKGSFKFTLCNYDQKINSTAVNKDSLCDSGCFFLFHLSSQRVCTKGDHVELRLSFTGISCLNEVNEKKEEMAGFYLSTGNPTEIPLCVTVNHTCVRYRAANSANKLECTYVEEQPC